MLCSKLRERLQALSPALLADARSRLELPEKHLDPNIRPFTPFISMIGTAVTVKLGIAENKASADLTRMLEAYESQTETGVIMVIEVPTALHSYGIFGDGAATIARKHGFLGVLVEGAVRDTPDLQKMDFPAFSRTIAPGYIIGKASVLDTHGPVMVGGQTIDQGDVIVADNDGVIVIPPQELEKNISHAESIKQWEEQVHKLYEEGGSSKDIATQVGPLP
tara:strand:+ start:130 stop:792 length:663 start_codon:yes stop_codon:yes gene_type:complete